MKVVPCLIVSLVAVVLTLSVATCLSAPRLIFTVPPVRFILCPDVNSDGHIDLMDIVAVSRSFGTVIASLEWNPKADINGDGRIDIFDIVLIASALNTTD